MFLLLKSIFKVIKKYESQISFFEGCLSTMAATKFKVWQFLKAEEDSNHQTQKIKAKSSAFDTFT